MTEKPKQLSSYVKISIFSLIVGATLSYSIIQKRKIERLTADDNYLILKKIPDLNVKTLAGKALDLKGTGLPSSKITLVHFWGTWCAPCEAELPDFIKHVQKFEKKGVKAILLAVKDDDAKIKKYLKRFSRLPDNIIVAHDKTGVTMVNFGTVKVPETYLFSTKNGKHLNKYVGPQDWLHQSYGDRLDFYLSLE
jgi:cytochrome c biogenesis protein CcmG, thiol:disulfide interchange protein DsbE